ncbi:hypothetical protein PN36_31940 [Candidatus Thiomargarita nelsonii]|uniref:Antitoxin SocA-like Panacea domain-containing protein n=1 Tax=Candidatus Thiomargarita nelsonii TaxID=1003181 RepID=A0A0A6RUN0_9GAMM|nr:hypothetical protein PN36_31940 [Candidatus Thiomargarita nelsonii]
MNKLQNIIAYFCVNYPHKGELSKARLTKLVYLTDWFSALVDDKKLTNINWVFNHYGPYVDDVVNSATKSEGFILSKEQTIYGSDKYLIGFNGLFDKESLSIREREILDAVINKTKSLYFNDFIDYVYSTYPVTSKNRYSELDLVSLAKEYKANKP